MDGLVNINYIVSSIMNDLNDYTINRLRLQQMVIEAITINNIYSGNSVDVHYAKMSSANMISLPGDYIDYTKIACNVNGQLWTLGRNDNMTIPKTVSDTIMCEIGVAKSTASSTSVYGGYYFASHYRGDDLVTPYSMGGGMTDIQYRIDKKRRTIYFSKNFTGDIILEYISSGVKEGNTMVAVEALPMIKAQVHWNLVEHDSRVGVSAKMRKEDLYDKELGRLTHLHLSFTRDEFLDMVCEGHHQGVKRG